MDLNNIHINQVDSNNINIRQIVNDFNSILMDFAVNIADVCPDSIIGQNIRTIEKALSKEERSSLYLSDHSGCLEKKAFHSCGKPTVCSSVTIFI